MMGMFFQILVSYDISNTKLRNEFFNTLKDFGLISIQKSVMWGYVNNAEERSIHHEIKNMLTEEDKCIALRIANAVLQIKKNGLGYKDFDFHTPDGYSVI